MSLLKGVMCECIGAYLGERSWMMYLMYLVLSGLMAMHTEGGEHVWFRD
jgi:hypothetical protein